MSGITLAAHHLVGPDLGFTCTNCGGHTSLTPPCIPAKTYLTIEDVIEAAVAQEPPEEVLLTAGELMQQAGLSHRQVDHWTSNGLLVPINGKHPGYGSNRLYPETELHKAFAIKAILQAGKTDWLREHIDQIITEGTLTTGPVTITYIPEEVTP